MKKLNNKGFTLVELMMVVVLMGVVMAVAQPAYSAIMKTVNKRECLTNQKYLQGLLRSYRVGDLDDTTHYKWLAGSYDPATNEWVGAVDDANDYIYTSYGLNAEGKYSFKDIPDQSAGDYFLRCAYKLSGPDDTVVFPSTGDGCELYIVFNNAKDANDAEAKMNQKYDTLIQNAVDRIRAEYESKYGNNIANHTNEMFAEIDAVYEKYNGVQNADGTYSSTNGKNGVQIRSEAVAEARKNASGYVEIHCANPEHEHEIPLRVYYR